MSNLPNTVIRLTPPSLRHGYCPSSWQEFANDLVCGTFAQHKLNRGTTFYNFGNQAPYPPPPTPEPPEPSCVDFQIDWEPAAFPMEEYVSFYLGDEYPSLDGATKLMFEAERYRQEPTYDVWFLAGNSTITEISFPNCTQYDAFFRVDSFTALTKVSFPVLVTQTGRTGGFQNYALIRIANCPNLTSVELPNLENSARLSIWGNASLSSLSLPKIIPRNGGDFYFDTNALDAASVNGILARFVATGWQGGDLDLSGGTNAAPTGQGIIDKATLNARPLTQCITN